MPTTKKKVVKKKTTTRKKTVKKKTVNKKKQVPEKQYINIYERDPIIETKSKLSWIIAGVLMILIISFWFWSMNLNISKSEIETEDQTSIASEINKSIEELKSIIGNTKDIIDYASSEITEQQEIEKIKNNVLQQIEVNLESDNWPQHLSEPLGVSFNYPGNWDKFENKEEVFIASYNLESTSTQEVYTEITIHKIENKNNIALEDLGFDFEQYKETDEEIFIDLVPATKYKSNIVENKNISYIIITEIDEIIYKIKVYSKNGENIFEPIINKILSTIDLL
jgi:hypothetical protein